MPWAWGADRCARRRWSAVPRAGTGYRPHPADSPRGPVKLDDYGNAIGNSFIRRIEMKDGKLVDTIVKTYSAVSQFWTYDPSRFLARPVYSRDYPPAKNLEP